MSQLEKFGEYTKEAAAKGRAEDATTGWLKMDAGTNVVRLLPPLVGMSEPWITIYQHFIKLPGGAQVVFNCPRKMSNGRCPGCEKGDRLKATGNPADEKASRDFWAGARNIAFALNRDDPDSGVQLFAFGSTIKKRLRHFREKLGHDITNFKTGFDIMIERTGQGLKTEYHTDLGEQCPITSDKKKLEAWLADLPDLVDFAKVIDYDQIVAKFAAAAGAHPPDHASAAPHREALKPATRRRTVEDDLADEDDEEMDRRVADADDIPF